MGKSAKETKKKEKEVFLTGVTENIAGSLKAINKQMDVVRHTADVRGRLRYSERNEVSSMHVKRSPDYVPTLDWLYANSFYEIKKIPVTALQRYDEDMEVLSSF